MKKGETGMITFVDIFSLIILINTIGAIITVFMKPRDIAATWAWLVVLTLLPVFGFILYLFTGRGLSTKGAFKIRKKDYKGLERLLQEESASDNFVFSNFLEYGTETSEVMQFFATIDAAPVIKRNQIRIFNDGHEKFETLFEDIRAAKESVHVEYYSFYSDQIGTRFRDLLIEKAHQGVEVRVLYDAFGSRGTTKRWFKPLIDAGGYAESFITSKNALLRFRINYHDHRKIVVIDGKVAYTGGFNVGDQYLGESPKFGYWRDTHIRIIGPGALGLQTRFLRDWNASIHESEHVSYDAKYFPIPKEATVTGDTPLQIVSSGPATQKEQIKLGYIKFISAAKERVWIQTPYLVPDESVISALKIAAASGIDVRIMIPCMPDHPFIYRATQYYAQLLHSDGVRIFIYQNGFLHSKTMLVDKEWISIGSANQDIRSYSLNFEVNAFMYDPVVVAEYALTFLEDMEHSEELTDQMIQQQGAWLRFKQKFSRLLSPVL